MANRDTSIDPKLLESARKHFLEHGFLGASLKAICADAGVTTGAVYKRYKGKEELFEAVVKGTVDTMNAIIEEASKVNPKELSDKELVAVWYTSEKSNQEWFERLMSLKEGFALILRCSEGTKYSTLHHDWIEKMTDVDYQYLRETQRRNLADKSITKRELHVILAAMWQMYYEPIVHNMSEEEIKIHCRVVNDLLDWGKAFGIKKIE